MSGGLYNTHKADFDTTLDLTRLKAYGDTMNDGKVQTIENDLTEMLRTFHTDMQTPLKISGTLLTPTAANPGTVTITDWQVQEVVDITIK